MTWHARFWVPDDPNTLAVMNNLALSYAGQARMRRPCRSSRTVLRMQKKYWVLITRTRLASMSNLRSCYRSQEVQRSRAATCTKPWRDAGVLCGHPRHYNLTHSHCLPEGDSERRAVRSGRARQVPEHQSTCMFDLGWCISRVQRHAEAVPLRRPAASGYLSYPSVCSGKAKSDQARALD